MSEPRDAAAHLNELGSRVLAETFQLARNALIHQPENVVFEGISTRLSEALAAIQATEREVALRFVHDTFFVNDLRLRLTRSLFGCARYIAAELKSRGLGGLGFAAGARAPDLREDLFRLFRLPVGGAPPSPGTFRVLAPLPPPREAELLLQESDGLREAALQSYGKAIYFLRAFFRGVKNQKPPKVGVARRIVNDLIDVCECDGQRFLNLANIKDYESLQQTHAVNTCVLAIGLGQAIGLSRAALSELGLCALFHELGRVFLPDDIQSGRRALTGHDRALLEGEPLLSVRALLSASGVGPSACGRIVVAWEHRAPFSQHATARRSGAPGLMVTSRIVAVCHAFDELTRYIHGRAPLLPDEALRALLEGAGTLYDPLLVKLLVNLLGMYPAGTPVRLDTGELAIVFYASGDPRFLDRPVVKVVRDASGRPCRERVLDLSLVDPRTGRYRASIVGSVAPAEVGLDPLPLLFGAPASAAPVPGA
ncbi:MAG: HD-GYP domain-containing protein [Myxococcales bacterium]